MNKTIIIYSHPFPERSVANKKIYNHITEKFPEIDYRIISNVNFNVEEEQKILEQYDSIIFQYPLYWTSVPGELKMYLDKVFTNKWAYNKYYALKGKKLGTIMTMGNKSSTYHAWGLNPFGSKIFNNTIWGLGQVSKMKNKGSKQIYSSRTKDFNPEKLDRFIKKFI